MTTLSLAWRYLWSRPLGAALNLLLLSLGLASITFLLLLGHQLQRAFERDLAGIDLVVGAKGSPLQLILSGVLHLDVPTGNVPLQAVQALEQNPLVASVIPISLGDSFQGFRIVGTSHAYPAHYQASLAQGSLWQAPMQAVLGASARAEPVGEVGAVAVALQVLLRDVEGGEVGLPRPRPVNKVRWGALEGQMLCLILCKKASGAFSCGTKDREDWKAKV